MICSLLSQIILLESLRCHEFLCRIPYAVTDLTHHLNAVTGGAGIICIPRISRNIPNQKAKIWPLRRPVRLHRCTSCVRLSLRVGTPRRSGRSKRERSDTIVAHCHHPIRSKRRSRHCGRRPHLPTGYLRYPLSARWDYLEVDNAVPPSRNCPAESLFSPAGTAWLVSIGRDRCHRSMVPQTATSARHSSARAGGQIK